MTYLLPGLLLSLCLIAPAMADTGMIPVLDGTVDERIWDTLPESPELLACNEECCAILKALLASFALLDERDLPNSMARTGKTRTPAVVKLPVVTSVAGPKNRTRMACHMLATINANYFDESVALHAIELSTDLEHENPGCVKHAVEALPPDTAHDLARRSNDLRLARHESHCSAIVE